MGQPEFAIPIHELDAGGKPYRFPIRVAWMRGAFEEQDATPAGEDGELDVRVSKSGTDVVVHGHLKAKLNVPCARCLGPAPVVVDEPISALMVPASSLKLPTAPGKKDKKARDDDDEADLGLAEADVLPYTGETIVLDDLVRDELILEIPMIPLCSDTCPGISPPVVSDLQPERDAGAVKPGEEVIDPRLAPLMQFKNKFTKE